MADLAGVRRLVWRVGEKVTARIAVSTDAHRPLSGPLARPCLALIDRVYAASSWFHRKPTWLVRSEAALARYDAEAAVASSATNEQIKLPDDRALRPAALDTQEVRE